MDTIGSKSTESEIATISISDDEISISDDDFDEISSPNTEIPIQNRADDETEKQKDKVNAAKLPNLMDVDVTKSLMGVQAATWQEFEPLYKKHAATVGFCCKKSTSRKNNGVVISKYFVCSCAGKPPPAQPRPVVKRQSKNDKNMNDMKTDCQALLRVKLVDGLFTVVDHRMRHNHNLTRPGWHYMHRSERRISEHKGEAMKTLDASGIGPTDAFRYLSNSAGGVEMVGHIQKDHTNYIAREKKKMLDGNDAQNLIDELTKCQKADPEFYFKPKLDKKDGRFEAVFFRDGRMKQDYLIYRDVVIFDTTYKTNVYDSICAPLVGVNNHWNNIMFGFAFINNETTDTFKWLLEAFLESMDGIKPTTIFTDQDAAMTKAIALVFGKETRHRLCLWHLQQNAVKNCPKLYENKEFKQMFHHCLSGCSDPFEFVEKWLEMIEKFDLKEHPWFIRLFGIREKWCTALSKDFFSAGILSSQRSESTNNAISFKAKQTTTLLQFFHIYMDTVARWRQKEVENEFKCSFKFPRTNVNAGLLQNAARVYTLTIFRFFEQEFEACLLTKAVPDTNFWQNNKKSYILSLENDPDDKPVTVYCVIDGENTEINCTCKGFEEVGWLCSHCLRVLFINNVTLIPKKYISKRWSKDAKTDVWNNDTQLQASKENDRIYWRGLMTKRYCELVMMSETNEDARRILEDSYIADELQIKALLLSKNLVEQSGSKNSGGEKSSVVAKESAAKSSVGGNKSVAKKVLDPIKSITKGSRKGKQPKKFGRRKAVVQSFDDSLPRNEHII